MIWPLHSLYTGKVTHWPFGLKASSHRTSNCDKTCNLSGRRNLPSKSSTRNRLGEGWAAQRYNGADRKHG